MPRDKATLTITGIWLRRSGNQAVVAVEIGGRWYDAISETYNGAFSHIAEPEGADNWKPVPFEDCGDRPKGEGDTMSHGACRAKAAQRVATCGQGEPANWTKVMSEAHSKGLT